VPKARNIIAYGFNHRIISGGIECFKPCMGDILYICGYVWHNVAHTGLVVGGRDAMFPMVKTIGYVMPPLQGCVCRLCPALDIGDFLLRKTIARKEIFINSIKILCL